MLLRNQKTQTANTLDILKEHINQLAAKNLVALVAMDQDNSVISRQQM